MTLQIFRGAKRIPFFYSFLGKSDHNALQFFWALLLRKTSWKKTCASTSVSSSAAQVFDHLYLLTSIFPVFPYQVFCLPFKEYTTSRSDHGLRSSVVKTFVFLIHFQSVKCILNVEQLFFHTLNSTIVLIAFLNALENCFLAGLSDLRGCIFFFPSFCVYSQMHIQSQYAFTLMALILILCPLAPSLQSSWHHYWEYGE